MSKIDRRRFLSLAVPGTTALAAGCGTLRTGRNTASFRLATFAADVTPPLGHALMGGGIAPATRVEDPLLAHGVVLLGAEQPLVILALDWCEVRNDAYERWRSVLAEAAGTEPRRVLLTCVHVHDAPIADLEAQRLLERRQAAGSICDLDFHERTVQRVARALRASLSSPRRITHFGAGLGRVEQVASNRRFPGANGQPTFGRTSSSRDALAHQAAEGTVDPWLRTLSFWENDRPLAALHCYATHPMSYYGKGGVSSDFVGMARRQRQAEDPTVAQMYCSGCSGNITAGKYNDGSPGNRPVLAQRIYEAMLRAWDSTRRFPLRRAEFRSTSLHLEPRSSPGFARADLERRLVSDPKPFGQCLAALGLSWQSRAEAGRPIDLPLIDFGEAQLLLLPAEAYVEYQLFAQEQRPGSFVMALGYGECAPGYIPTEKAWQESDTNLQDWCWVAPGSELRMKEAIQRVFASHPKGSRGPG